MEIKDLMPWRRSRKALAAQGEVGDRMEALQKGIGSLFEDFARRMQLSGEWLPFGGGAFSPRVDMTEDGEAVTVVAELPGLDENAVEVALSGTMLTLQGEKKQEQEQREGDTYRLERSFGAFRRVLQLPCEVEPDKVQATFRNGVLTVTLPKSKAAKESRHKIAVKAG